jgi:hypothetical protein
VADIPESAIQAGIDKVMTTRGLTADHQRVWAEPIVRAALEGAAPVMAKTVAAKILAHMEAREPKARGDLIGGSAAEAQRRRTWRRHFGIAARVAGFAFSTPEDIKRAAIEAIARGDIAVCHDDHGKEGER